MIYGITGKKGHGKDTLADAIMRLDSSYSTVHFANLLKSMCRDIFNLRAAQVHDPKVKEETLAAPVIMDEFIPHMINLTGLEIEPQQKVAYTPREIMQYFGTDYVRKVQNDYWVSRTLKTAQKLGNVLIPDTRFINEYEAVKAAGGKIVRLVRIGGPISTIGMGHASETEMDRFEPDFVFKIPNGAVEKFEEIARDLVKGSML